MELFFDGSSKGNPGRGASGWLLRSQTTTRFGWLVHEHCTNNTSEYRGLTEALAEIVAGGAPRALKVMGDSDLVIKQMKGVYRVKNEGLIPLHKEAMGYVRVLQDRGCAVTFQHVRREANTLADHLTNVPLRKSGLKRRAKFAVKGAVKTVGGLDRVLAHT